MRAIQAETFSGYSGLRQIELLKPKPAKDRLLVRVTAAGVTPLDHTILSGGLPRTKAPLVLGNEGVGVIEDAGDSGFAVGSRVMFAGPYGVRESGAWQEWLLVRPEDAALVPDAIDNVSVDRWATRPISSRGHRAPAGRFQRPAALRKLPEHASLALKT
jgi:NADPH2:quinone reductase